MTNLEKIKLMTAEEFADFIDDTNTPRRCEFCKYRGTNCIGKICADGIEKWLKSETEMTNLEIAKSIVNQYFSVADCGIFCTRNLVGDTMENIHNNNGLIIDICYEYEYFEVFGLKPCEFKELKDYYDLLCKESEK